MSSPAQTIRTGDLFPGISDRLHKMAAEILACYHPDPYKLREHRIRKMKSFPEDDQDQLREIVSRVILARRNGRNY